MTARPPAAEAVPEPLTTSQKSQALHSLLQQLYESQYWTPKQLALGQLQQLKKLVAYAILYSPFYKKQFSGVDVNQLDMQAFAKLPLLTRLDLQAENEGIDCVQVPQLHGAINQTMTSGSTATPVSLRGTALTTTIWNALNMREELWHRRDYSQITASIRWNADPIGLAPEGIKTNDWDFPVNQFYKTAASYYLNSSSDISAQLQWLQKIQPAYLMTHPSNLRAMLDESRRLGLPISGLKQVRTVGENVSDDLREAVHSELGAKLVDFYSSQEVGYLALQCPETGHYHVQSESVLLEVLREDGSVCDVGESGKIVVTSLRNYATPLIRYEIGDYGELGPPCSCGRSLPVLQRINGRTRNMLHLPSGSKSWPNFGFRKIMQVAELHQFQVIQHGLESIELKVVLDEKLKPEQEQKIKQFLCEHLGHPFAVNLTYHSDLPRSANGKFEDFISMLEPGT